MSLHRRRRWPWIAGIVAVVLLTAAGLAWAVWLPQYRPGAREGERYGIDVSHHQGPIEWERVAGDDISFAYIKATEGGDFVDPRFQENWIGSGEAGLARGAYHFFTLCSSGDVQARHFLLTAPPEAGALPPAVDLEIAGNCRAAPEAATVRRELDEFLQLVEAATGQTVLLYVGDDFEERYRVAETLGRPLWVRRFLRRPDVRGWVVWQVTGFAHVDGIDGAVDLDLMRISPT